MRTPRALQERACTALIVGLMIATTPLAACQMSTPSQAQEQRVSDDPVSNFPTPQVAKPEPGTDVIMPMQPPRDPAIAVREEYDAAVAKNTIAAYELFITRHPGSPLVADVKRRVQALN